MKRYRYDREKAPSRKKTLIAIPIAREIENLWRGTLVPNVGHQSIVNMIVELINEFTASRGNKREERSSFQFQKSLDSLFDIRPKKYIPLSALKDYLKSWHKDNWEEEYKFFRGQLEVSRLCFSHN